MSDEKRYYRELKQQVKRTGNKKMRRFLKDPNADPSDFDYGTAESAAFNGRDGKNRKRKGKKPPRE
jgi:hypothetical protein